jgi:uncharacterized protein YggT (Ycf19 family)
MAIMSFSVFGLLAVLSLIASWAMMHQGAKEEMELLDAEHEAIMAPIRKIVKMSR